MTQDTTVEPFVPNKFVFAVYCGVPYEVYYHGTELSRWIDSGGNLLADILGDLRHTGCCDLSDGVYLWEGHYESCRSYDGDYDAWLEVDNLRLLTKEEWVCITKDEIPWDLEAVRAQQAWLDDCQLTTITKYSTLLSIGESHE